MNSKEIVELSKKHTLYTWTATGQVDPIPVDRAQGVYFWDTDGKRYLDFNSQLMSVNIGHSHPKVIKAIQEASEKLTYVYPGTATEARAKLGQKLAQWMPDSINTFFFTLAGAEANENAIRAARLYTGRFKILARYRSYHGGTNLCMQLTGDPRRLHNEPGSPGIIHVMDPRPYVYQFGQTEEEQTAENLKYLEEVIMYEGPDQIAAMIVETVIGSNGVQPPPKGYLKGLHKLLKKYGILLITDEVMAGFGRTGKRFAFEHYDIVPDIVTMAKGLTSSYVPLGAVALSDPIAAYFQDHVFWGGLTYNSHALALSTALAVLDVYEEDGLIENAAALEPVMKEEMAKLKAHHPWVKEYRAIGLFGMVDLQKNAQGEPMAPYGGSSPAMKHLNKALLERGLFTFVRWGSFMCNPPLCITETELREGFAIIDNALAELKPYYQEHGQ